MNKKSIYAVSALALFAFMALAHANETSSPKTLIKFHSMVGNSFPYLYPDGPLIRGISGGPHPWVLQHAEGELKSDGALHIQIRGLIIPNNAGFGYNPAPYFQAVVSCKTLDSNGNTYYENIVTLPQETRMIGDPRLGNAVIDAKVALPNTVIAPIVFITSPAENMPPTGLWFAATGFGP